MEVRRTVPVKLDVDDSDADLLRETIQQFLDSANDIVEFAPDGEYVETRRSVILAEMDVGSTRPPISGGSSWKSERRRTYLS
jgi:hypothetical protein